MRDLTLNERNLVRALGDCFNDHQHLEKVHPSDGEEFARAIQAAQNIVLARPGTEAVAVR